MTSFEWMKNLERRDLEDARAVLRELKRCFVMKRRILEVKELPFDAPERLPIGNEEPWFRQRRETIDLLIHHGVIEEIRGQMNGLYHVVADQAVVIRATNAAELLVTGPPSAKPLTAAPRSKHATGPAKTVFVVHGRDETNLLKLVRMLEKDFKLNVVVMKDEAAQGRTLIEKFEEEASSADYAFILMSPDDQVATPDGSYSQARPNVTFELGWFVGRLSRKRVALLVREGTRMHSDFDGIQRIEFRTAVDEVHGEIKRELDALA